VKEKPTVGSPFFGAFPSDSIPQAAKGVMTSEVVPTFETDFRHAAVPANYTSEFREISEAATYFKNVLHCVMEFGAVRPV
jgi:hypothetical protein